MTSCDEAVSDFWKYNKIENANSTGSNLNLLIYSSTDKEELYKLYGKCGGSGGDGGRGGYGGHNGNIEIFTLNSNQSGIERRSEMGRRGVNGTGGVAGNTVVITAICHSKNVSTLFIPMSSNVIWYERDTSAEISCGEKRGKNGHNDADIESPAEKSHPMVSFIVNEYKAFMRNNLQLVNSKDDALAFIDTLETDERIRSTYDTLGLVNEFYVIEQQLHANEVDLTSSFEHFQMHVQSYASKRMSTEMSADYTHILEFLNASAITRLTQLKETPLISLESAQGSLRPPVALDKDVIVQQQAQSFEHEVDARQQEANDYIANHIIPEINRINSDLEHCLKELATETVALRKIVIEKKRKNEYELKKVRKTLLLRKIFSSLETLASFLGFFGPYGSLAQAIVDGVINFIEWLIVRENEVTVSKPVNLPPSIQHIMRNVGRRFKMDIARTLRDSKINRRVSHSALILNDYIENMSNASPSRTTESIEILTHLDRQLSVMVDDIRNSPIILRSNDSSTAINDSNEFTEWIASTNHTIDSMQNLAVTSDIARLEETIDTLNEHVESLQKYEKRIYNILYPMVRTMQNDLKSLQRKLHNRSHVILDAAKLKVQSTMRDFQIEFLMVTKGFKIEEKVQVIIQKLNDAIVTLISIFDRIQTYADEKRLANHIFQMNSAKPRRFKTQNIRLQNALEQLERVMSENNAMRFAMLKNS